jgi:molybdopterin molybdotransferase
MPEFLSLYPPKEALDTWLSALGPTTISSEEIDLIQAVGRVTSKPFIAPHDLPDFTRSAMDGYAVKAADTNGTSEGLPTYLDVIDEIPMGKVPVFSLKLCQAALIHTGGMLPDGADAVVMLENTQMTRPGEIEVTRAVTSNENVIQKGEDIVKGQEVISAGVRLRPAEIGGLAALGFQRISVVKRPRIGIISSGDEVVPLGATPLPGQVRDANTYALGSLIEEKGGLPKSYGIVSDDPDKLRIVLLRALNENDAVVITAGSSASSRDLTSQIIQESGKPGVLVHGVNIRPGKPTILAVCGTTPVIGLPGNPVSALVIAMLFVSPLIDRLLGISKPRPVGPIKARLMINVPSLAGREEWIPVIISGDSHEYQADPIFFKSNLIFNLSKADGLMKIPVDATGLSAGESVDIYPF